MTAYWKTLQHNGVVFPDPYVPDGLSVKVKGTPVALSPLGEEMAYSLAKKKDTPYIQDPVFRSNFMSDFVKHLPGGSGRTRFEDVDFAELYAKVDEEKRIRESMGKEAKKALAGDRKRKREALKEKYGYATIDGKRVEFANYLVEPPGLFMGRGQHPLRGRWKPRVTQSQVVLNLGREATVPPGDWKKVVHDHNSMWMAKWVDRLTGKEKYVWLHESSELQQSRNRAKYDKARKVGGKLGKMRARIQKALDSKDLRERQVATVCYLIDALGMRVGDEKDEDEADTVGASTLRVEHVKLEGSTVNFSFLGKDSVAWNKSDTPPPAVLRNLGEAMGKKRADEELFHSVSSAMVNQFLSSIVPGASAKVFRTFHATVVAKDYLASHSDESEDELGKLYQAREANLRAAIFCNHQRTPPKTWGQSFERKKQKLADAKARQAKPDRIRKLKMELDFYRRTKNYNLNTSLKNYIDPRVYKEWCDQVGLDWAKLYSKSLQRKFSWVAPAESD
jgi:DNA topoisomerase I